MDYDNPVQPATVSTQEWEDVFRFSVGVNWQQSPKLLLRAGLAFDEEAIPGPGRRTARIPGNDRTWLSLGGGLPHRRELLGRRRLHPHLPRRDRDRQSERRGRRHRRLDRARALRVLGRHLQRPAALPVPLSAPMPVPTGGPTPADSTITETPHVLSRFAPVRLAPLALGVALALAGCGDGDSDYDFEGSRDAARGRRRRGRGAAGLVRSGRRRACRSRTTCCSPTPRTAR